MHSAADRFEAVVATLEKCRSSDDDWVTWPALNLIAAIKRADVVAELLVVDDCLGTLKTAGDICIEKFTKSSELRLVVAVLRWLTWEANSRPNNRQTSELIYSHRGDPMCLATRIAFESDQAIGHKQKGPYYHLDWLAQSDAPAPQPDDLARSSKFFSAVWRLIRRGASLDSLRRMFAAINQPWLECLFSGTRPLLDAASSCNVLRSASILQSRQDKWPSDDPWMASPNCPMEFSEIDKAGVGFSPEGEPLSTGNGWRDTYRTICRSYLDSAGDKLDVYERAVIGYAGGCYSNLSAVCTSYFDLMFFQFLCLHEDLMRSLTANSQPHNFQRSLKDILQNCSKACTPTDENLASLVGNILLASSQSPNAIITFAGLTGMMSRDKMNSLATILLRLQIELDETSVSTNQIDFVFWPRVNEIIGIFSSLRPKKLEKFRKMSRQLPDVVSQQLEEEFYSIAKGLSDDLRCNVVSQLTRSLYFPMSDADESFGQYAYQWLSIRGEKEMSQWMDRVGRVISSDRLAVCIRLGQRAWQSFVDCHGQLVHHVPLCQNELGAAGGFASADQSWIEPSRQRPPGIRAMISSVAHEFHFAAACAMFAYELMPEDSSDKLGLGMEIWRLSSALSLPATWIDCLVRIPNESPSTQLSSLFQCRVITPFLDVLARKFPSARSTSIRAMSQWLRDEQILSIDDVSLLPVIHVSCLEQLSTLLGHCTKWREQCEDLGNRLATSDPHSSEFTRELESSAETFSTAITDWFDSRFMPTLLEVTTTGTLLPVSNKENSYFARYFEDSAESNDRILFLQLRDDLAVHAAMMVSQTIGNLPSSSNTKFEGLSARWHDSTRLLQRSFMEGLQRCQWLDGAKQNLVDW